jgi:hypothetical protein
MTKERLFFRTFEKSSLKQQAGLKPLACRRQQLAHFGDGWLTSCMTRACLRIAFNNMNKSRVSSAKAPHCESRQEYWRTGYAFRRITEANGHEISTLKKTPHGNSNS